MSTRLQRVMPNWPPDGEAVTAPAGSGDHRPRRPSPEPLNAVVARELEPHIGSSWWRPSRRQDSDTYIFCLSRLPDSGMILIGSHEDRAPYAESFARPPQLVELPALLDHPLIIQTIRRDPSGSDQIDA